MNGIIHYISNYPLIDVAEKIFGSGTLSFTIGVAGSLFFLGTPIIGFLNLSISLVAGVVQEITQPFFEILFYDPHHPGTMSMIEYIFKKIFNYSLAVVFISATVLGPHGTIFAIATLTVNIAVTILISLPVINQRVPLDHRSFFVIL